MTIRNTRVLIVGPSLRYLGGQAVQAQRLVEALRTVPELTVEYLVVDPVLPGPLRVLQRVPVLRTIATSIAYVASLLKALPSFETVHIFSASYWSFLIAPTPALVLGRLFGKRVLLNYHSGEADDHLTRWGWHAKPLLRLADAIVVPTEYLVGVFAKHGLNADAIANHVDVGAMKLRERVTMIPRFFSNRNFEPHYNVQSTIDAFAEVQRQHPGAELVITGGGSQREALEGSVARHGLRNVRFTGPVQPEAMAQLYCDADVYVNASLIDNMPLSLLEAYAAGLPVITSNAGGIPWIAQDGVTARMIAAGDTAALAAAMLEVAAHPDAAWQRATAARSFVATNYSWDAVSARWRAVYSAAADLRALDRRRA